MLLAGFEARLQSDSATLTPTQSCLSSLRAKAKQSRDDKQELDAWSLTLLAMTADMPQRGYKDSNDV
jgi:hypothetical protein